MATRKRQETDGDTVHSESSGAVPSMQQSDVTHSVVPMDGFYEYTVTSTIKVNYGNFEGVNPFAAVKARFAADVPIEDVAKDMDERAFTLLSPQLEAASVVAQKSSFVHSLID